LPLIAAPVAVTPETPSEEKSTLVLTTELPALLLLATKDTPSGEKPTLVFTAKVQALIEDPPREKPAVLAAKIPFGEKPAVLGARCQHYSRSEKCDELQHDGLC
jgi:hypothetical protein